VVLTVSVIVMGVCVSVVVIVVVRVVVVMVAARTVHVVVIAPGAVFVVGVGVVVVVPVVVIVGMPVVVIVVVRVILAVQLPGFSPHTDRPEDDQDQHRDPADQHRQPEVRGEDVLELVILVHADRHEPEQAHYEEGEQLLREIVPQRIAVVMMIVSHDGLPEQTGTKTPQPGNPVHPFAW
jgi:hypothetical protein